MSHLDILVPFGLPPAELAPDLLRELKIPAFATLIARAKPSKHESFDGFSRALPHEAWLSNRFDLDSPLPGSSPALAGAMMRALALTPTEGVWFMLHPVHIHITRDHLVLTDMRQLTLSEQESRALFDVARPLFEEMNKTLLYGDAQTWFVRADDWHELQTATPDAACGHNIDIWMPKESGARDWRKLQNEVQMHWHQHPINAEREAHDLKPVNSLWIWGGAPVVHQPAHQSAPSPYQSIFNLNGWMRGLGALTTTQMQVCAASDLFTASPQRDLLILDSLIEPALGSDWSDWLAKFHALETDWFMPLLAALKDHRIEKISLILTHNAGWSEFTTNRHSLRKFWVQPSLKRLHP